jgi:hypothetical protein
MCNKSLFHRPRCADKYMAGFRIDSRTIKRGSLLLIQVVRRMMNGNGWGFDNDNHSEHSNL